jgi:hypothetical protein
LLPSPPLRLLPGGAIQFPGRPFIPLWSSAFHGAPLTPGYVSNPKKGVTSSGCCVLDAGCKPY